MCVDLGPCITVFVYTHAKSILTFAWMTAVLFRANDFLRSQVSLRSERRARDSLYLLLARGGIHSCRFLPTRHPRQVARVLRRSTEGAFLTEGKRVFSYRS